MAEANQMRKAASWRASSLLGKTEPTAISLAVLGLRRVPRLTLLPFSIATIRHLVLPYLARK
jgi:hypothetical protein